MRLVRVCLFYFLPSSLSPLSLSPSLSLVFKRPTSARPSLSLSLVRTLSLSCEGRLPPPTMLPVINPRLHPSACQLSCHSSQKSLWRTDTRTHAQPRRASHSTLLCVALCCLARGARSRAGALLGAVLALRPAANQGVHNDFYYKNVPSTCTLLFFRAVSCRAPLQGGTHPLLLALPCQAVAKPQSAGLRAGCGSVHAVQEEGEGCCQFSSPCCLVLFEPTQQTRVWGLCWCLWAAC